MDIGGGRRWGTSAVEDDHSLAELSDAELSVCLTRVFDAEQSLAAQRLALTAEIDRRAQPMREGATSTIAWLRDKLRIKGSTAAQMVRLARALADSLPATADALAHARINVEQAAVIAHTITTLPAEIGWQIRSKAEQVLLDHSVQFEPRQLAILGERVLDHVAPEIAEEIQLKALRRAEARAYRLRAFTMSQPDRGRVRLSGWLDTESAAIVTAAISPLCAPAAGSSAGGSSAAGSSAAGSSAAGSSDAGSSDAGSSDAGSSAGFDDRTAAQRRADALVEVCRLSLTSGELPVHGGEAAHLTVIMPYEPWHDETEAMMGHLDNGATVTPET